MVKPAGTGRPIRHISARLAPLPPSSSFCLPVPSADFPPKKYTYLAMMRSRTPEVRVWTTLKMYGPRTRTQRRRLTGYRCGPGSGSDSLAHQQFAVCVGGLRVAIDGLRRADFIRPPVAALRFVARGRPALESQLIELLPRRGRVISGNARPAESFFFDA